MIFLETINNEVLNKENFLLYIHTPFCGTCHLAKSMLDQIESTHGKTIFYEMNASLFPELMQEWEVESVPCLMIKVNGVIQEKVYVFHSIPNIYYHLAKHSPETFLGNK